MNHARRDLCGGCSAMCIPTAILVSDVQPRYFWLADKMEVK